MIVENGVYVLNEENFEKFITETKKVLVFFYRESGCSFCDKMKPVIDSLVLEEKDFLVAKYALAASPDSINQKYPIERFPTYYAFVDGKPVGKQEGAMPMDQLFLTFTPEKLPPKQVPVEKATMLQLLSDEAILIDQIAPIRLQLSKIQKEIAKRKKLAIGSLEACCDGCASGGSCESGH
jgi:thioredoxin-like negative regulator of GroEL